MPEIEKDTNRGEIQSESVDNTEREIKDLDPDGVEFANDKEETKREDKDEENERDKEQDNNMEESPENLECEEEMSIEAFDIEVERDDSIFSDDDGDDGYLGDY